MTRLEIHPRQLLTMRRVLTLRKIQVCRELARSTDAMFQRVAQDELKEINLALLSVNRGLERTPRADELLRKMREEA